MKVFVLKPDGIGDFVLASGAIRQAAREYGEENLVLCVHAVVADLAGAQFPKAKLLPLPLLAKRKVLNLFTANLLRTLPAWLWVLRNRIEVAISLRHMRDYLSTFLFLSTGAKKSVVCQNQLLHSEKQTRSVVERVLMGLGRVQKINYPTREAAPPWEIEANRRVIEAALGRPVSLSEVWPMLQATPRSGPPYWLLCPFSSMRSKDYPPAKWQSALQNIPRSHRPDELLLSGSAAQRDLLEQFGKELKQSGWEQVRVVIEPGLQNFAELIAGAGLVLTVDTAAAHMATALDRPCLVLFSGLHCGMFAPWQRSSRQIWLMPETGNAAGKWHERLPMAKIEEAIETLGGQKDAS